MSRCHDCSIEFAPSEDRYAVSRDVPFDASEEVFVCEDCATNYADAICLSAHEVNR